jgi:hypothetical protein
MTTIDRMIGVECSPVFGPPEMGVMKLMDIKYAFCSFYCPFPSFRHIGR